VGKQPLGVGNGIQEDMSYLGDFSPEERQQRAWFGRLVSDYGYPEDVCSVLQLVVDMWNLRIPQHKKDKGYWIESARRLMDAGGAKHEDVLRAVHADFETHIRKNSGLAPYIVEGPGSLVKMTRAKEAQMSQQGTPEAARRKYVEGEFSEFIEH